MTHTFPEDTALGRRIRRAVVDSLSKVSAEHHEVKEYGRALRIGGAHVPNGQVVDQLGIQIVMKKTGVLKWGEFKSITNSED
jgi:hypothetical protein